MATDAGSRPIDHVFQTKTPDEKEHCLNEKYFAYNELGHFTRDCKLEEEKNKNNTADLTTMKALSRLIAAAIDKGRSRRLIIDSGRTKHMCNRRETFLSYSGRTDVIHVRIAETAMYLGYGSATSTVVVERTHKSISVKEVLHKPELMCSLISLSLEEDNGFKVSVDNDHSDPISGVQNLHGNPCMEIQII